jgi:Fur family ferric uptake transcriptional regulator
MERIKKDFKSFMIENNLRHTHQRDIIIEELHRIAGHLTPDEFYEVIKENHPEIGKATVYRTLKLLEQAKLIARVEFGDGKVRYEMCANKHHHDHLICEKCNKSIEVLDPKIEDLQYKLAKHHEFKLTGHRLYLYGICKDCQKK